MNLFKKVAIANRGEVAVRIIRACEELGITSVLLHSKADQHSRAYRLANETVCIGDSPVNESYLSIDKNIQGLLASGADAVHPGFGFLSENGDFAQAVLDAGKVFIGPRPETIRLLGDKIQAKNLVEESGIPTLPGYKGEDQSTGTLVQEAKKIGFPVIVKATAGGGGRGMKIIENESQALERIESAQREGEAAFGSPSVFLEKYLDRAKHIEIQVFADLAGNVCHLFERECSLQRRHQKIIEEAPSASLNSDIRTKLYKAATTLARSAGYMGAGTVEFLVQDDQFYFLEMNTRLQVEHPVTEAILGVDLVKAQILAQCGRATAWPQETLLPQGHSIECRIYAEDPYSVGIPSTGTVEFQKWPQGPGRRFEFAFEAGDEVTAFYDSMIAKVIVWDETRDRAIEKMLSTLKESVIFGVKTNIPLLKSLLSHELFRSSGHTTRFMQQNFPEGLPPVEPNDQVVQFAEKAWQQVSDIYSGGTSFHGFGSVSSSLASPGMSPSGARGGSPFYSYWRNR